jgi:hypothetical protein
MAAIVPATQVVAADVEVSTPTPLRPPTVESLTGTPGTDGQKVFGTYQGQPIPEPHRIWKFDVILPKLTAPGSGVNVATPIVQNLECGFDNTTPEQYPIGGRHHVSANFFDATALNLLFYNDENQTPIEYILAWKKLIRNYDPNTGLDDGTYNYPEGTNGYFKPIVVILQNIKSQAVYRITYDKCFPTAMQPMRLDYEPSGRTVIGQTFAVNRIISRKDQSAGQGPPAPAIPKAGTGFSVVNLQRLQL